MRTTTTSILKKFCHFKLFKLLFDCFHLQLQPQIATADGQPIMQLAPTSIPATLQFAPQALNSNQTFQGTAAVTAFNNNSTFPTQLIQQQQLQQSQIQHQHQTQQLQATQIQQQVLPHTTNTQVQQQTHLPQPTPPPQTQPQPTQITAIPTLPKNVQITSQQVLNTGNKKTKTPTITNTADISSSSESEKQLPKITATVSQGGSGDLRRVIKQQKYKISQQPGSNTIEITPTTSFTQQIMQQVQQQQQQKQKLNQQQSSAEPTTTTTVTTQHGGITVQRITTKINPTTTTSTANVAKDTVTHSTRQATITPLLQQPQLQQQTVALPKLPMLNKQNITISRITPQNHLQQSKPKAEQQQQTSQIGNTTVKVVQQQIKSQVSATPLQISTASGQQQQKQQTLPTRTIPQQQQQQLKLPSQHQQQSQIISNIPNTTLRISPVKKCIKRPPQKSIETSQTTTLPTNTTSQQRQTATNSNKKNATTASTTTASSTQVHYVTDITSILPTPNENTAPSSDSNVPTMATQTTTATDTNNTTNPDNSDQAKNSLECSQCGRVFKKKEHLTQHVKLHSGVRPFKCNEEGCTKAFHRKEHLLRHLVSHTGKKMFNCDICQKPFSRKDNLSKHRK